MVQRDRVLYIWHLFLPLMHCSCLPAFGIYGHDVQEADDSSVPEDVQEKLPFLAAELQLQP